MFFLVPSILQKKPLIKKRLFGFSFKGKTGPAKVSTVVKGGNVFSDLRLMKCLIHANGSMEPTSLFGDEAPKNFVCDHRTRSCAGLAYNEKFWPALNVNLKPQYRYYVENKAGKLQANVNAKGEWKPSKVELELPVDVWSSYTMREAVVTTDETETDEMKQFFESRTEYSPSTPKAAGNKGLINGFYLGCVMYPRPGCMKRKKVFHPITGDILLEKERAIFRLGYYKKGSYETFTDLYSIGRNSRYLLSPEEFEAMPMNEKVQ